ncbi:MAG: type II/IV secretion system ATPase subunit [Methanoregula sp.]
MTEIFRGPFAGRPGNYYQKTISALSGRSLKGTFLLLTMAVVAVVTGIVVLFIDMPIPLMGILSVISLVALILFIIGARARFSPVLSASMDSASFPVLTPNKNLTAKPDNKQSAHEFFEPYLRMTRSLGNRTDRGDSLILACCLVGIATAYIAFFVNVPIAILVPSGILSIAAFGTVCLGAVSRFAPGQMAILLPDENDIPKFVPRPTDVDPIPESPELCEKPGGSCLNVYWVQSPFVYIKIIRQGNLGLVYTVVEPVITAREKIVLQETYNYLREVIIFDNPEKSPVDLLKAKNVYRILLENDPTISPDRLPILNYYLQRDLSGFGLLEPLMHDPALEDISCNGENMPVFVFHRVFGSLRTSVIFRRGELNQFVLKLAQKANKQISLSTQMVDAALPDGSRVQITYSNVISTNGSSFTVRKFRADPMTPLDLIKFETYNSEILAFLWLVIEHRKSLIIAGGTASGKTSTMNAISLFIPLNSKIVSLEDTREIQLPHKNWLATQTRELNTPGVQGDVDLFSLLKSSMRQRPEFIIVGEVRGKEAQTLFQAMNTGHATLSTLHAGSVQEAINRLTHEPINVPSVMFTALDLVVNQAVYSFGSIRLRRCSAIHEISVDDQGIIIPVKLYEWDIGNNRFSKTEAPSRVLKEIASMRNWSMEQVAIELKRREEFLNMAIDAPHPDIIDLANAIQDLGD